MIDLYYWPTPNGWKLTIFLEESGLPYTLKPVNIGRGEQFAPDFLKISPNNRMPAIVDHAPADGGEPQSVFESGAILLYLADKTGRYLPRDQRGRTRVTEWLMWQMGGLGPMMGQHGHFKLYAQDKIAYAIQRYRDEVSRLFGVLEKQLSASGPFVCGAYSIADMAIFAWVRIWKAQEIPLVEFPHIQRWHDMMWERPAVLRAMKVGKEFRAPRMDEEARKILFGQTASTVAR